MKDSGTRMGPAAGFHLHVLISTENYISKSTEVTVATHKTLTLTPTLTLTLIVGCIDMHSCLPHLEHLAAIDISKLPARESPERQCQDVKDSSSDVHVMWHYDASEIIKMGLVEGHVDQP